MRILVADQNALLLAAITATFGGHCDLVTATRREVCLEHAEQKFDVVVAGDKLVDYTGLELLSEMAGLFPETLLIFAASPARLKRLSSRLPLFGLSATLSYPLTPRNLLDALKRARESLPPKAARQPRHVVLESEWDTGERLGLVEREIQDVSTQSPAHEGWYSQGSVAESPAVGAAPQFTITEDFGDTGLVHGALDDSCARPSVEPHQIGFETEAALDDFVFAPAPVVARPAVARNEPTPGIAASPTDIELPPSAVPIAQAVGTDHLADDPMEEADPDIGLDEADIVTNDSLFDQPEAPAETQWAEDGAANDTLFESNASGSTRSATGKSSPPATKGAGESGERARPSLDKRPKVRTPSQPTAAQLEAFQRARARRDAERMGAPVEGAGSAARKAIEGQPEGSSPVQPSNGARPKSLSELARMAVNKRPLLVPKLNLSGAPPKRAVFVVGSGLAAALIVGALFFEVLRTPSGATEHLARAPVAQTPFAASQGTEVTNSNYTAPDEGEHFTPAPPPPQQPAPTQTEQPPQTIYPEGYDAYGNPLAPLPPPPQVERPGPMEPPSTSSMDIVRGPPAGMMPPGFEPQPE
jgi:hypothetical protein